MGLRAKFNLVMLATFAVGLAIAAALAYGLSQQNARQAVLQEAAIMMAAASATSDFTDHEIAPLLADQMTVRFLPQAIPFWAAQTNFRRVTASFPDYTFREPALNPTNLADRAADWEAGIIDVFRNSPKLTQYVSERQTPTGDVLSLSHPIVVDAGCLSCHATAAAAPASMVELYGPSNGFGWKAGEVVGAEIVSVPMDVARARAWRSFLALLGGLVAVFALVLVMLNLLLHYTVLRPVRRLAAMADQVSTGTAGVADYTPRGRDEVASLAVSFNRMRRSVENAMRMLDA